MERTIILLLVLMCWVDYSRASDAATHSKLTTKIRSKPLKNDGRPLKFKQVDQDFDYAPDVTVASMP
ncbi:MAG: hypothetical protein KAH18_08770 [Psychromonas sp.]|nr:hypothetical protein [Psychromonas sp.]